MSRTHQSRSTSRHSKELSWLLRHGARGAGVAIDPAGWVAIADVLRALKMTRAQLDDAVANNNKSRLTVDGGRIRACQGHSLECGVSLDALEASWAIHDGAGRVWHGTAAAVVPSIAAEGILPQRRTHVHLAPTLGSAVGKRAQVDVMLGIDPDRLRAAGITLYRAQNGVILARRIPPECIVELRAMTHASRAREQELRGYLSQQAG